MAERFTLISELGRGGMGEVWKARDEETGQIVALKLLSPQLAAEPDYLKRFERELELVRRVHSAHVVRVFGYGVRQGTPYIAFEFIDGPSLRDRLAAHGPYSWTEARPMLIQMVQGLADAHAAGIIHRDLKPSNILLTADGTIKLADFGISKSLDLTRVTGTSTLLGTPAYLPPEGPIDERSDLYSLGIVAYELLTGVAPFSGSTYQEVIVRHIRETPDLSKLPPEARRFVGWLLEKDPRNRPQRASELFPLLYGAQPTDRPTASTPASMPAAIPPRPTPIPGPRPTPTPPPIAPRPTPTPAPSPAPIPATAAGGPPAPAWSNPASPPVAWPGYGGNVMPAYPGYGPGPGPGGGYGYGVVPPQPASIGVASLPSFIPRGPAAGVEWASYTRRFVAWLLDVVLLYLLALPTSLLMAADRTLDAYGSPAYGPLAIAASLTYCGLLIGYFPVMWTVFGATLGQMPLGLRVVKERDGSRIDLGSALGRLVGLILTLLVGIACFPVGTIAVLATIQGEPRKRMWQDRMAGTLVVRNE